MNRASAPGNGFVFLMAGASTDYTENTGAERNNGQLENCFVFTLGHGAAGIADRLDNEWFLINVFE